jgi:virginiamycin A acetyltransferase
MKNFIKSALNLISLILVLPLGLVCRLEEITLRGRSEVIFGTCTHIVAMLPGMPGAFLRRAFYALTLEECSLHCHIGFGTIFSHRTSVVKRHVYIGNYTLIGSAYIGEYSLIGSRASIISGGALHTLGDDGQWTPFSVERVVRVSVSKNVWVGEGAIIVADVGEGSMVGAGSVVTAKVKPKIFVTGNPCRFIKKMDEAENV